MIIIKNHKKLSSIGILFLLFVNLFILSVHSQSFILQSDATRNLEYDDYDGTGDISLKIAGYEESRTGSGSSLEVMAHQSYKNDSFSESFSNLSQSGSFIVPCPTQVAFNSSFTNFTVESIVAPDKELIIEDEEIQANRDELLTFARYASFEVEGSGYLENLSILISEDSGGDQDFYVDIYNAYFDGSYIKYNQSIAPTSQVLYNIDHSALGWENITDWHVDLDTRFTYNNTFFVRLACQNAANGYWHYGSNGVYDSIIWRQGGTSPMLTSNDEGLKVYLTPYNNTPNPEDIGMEINGIPVTGYASVNGSGFWTTGDEGYSDADGGLNLEITAGWWDVSCTIDQVLINYTRTDLLGSSAFDISGSGQDVSWNVTVDGGISGFHSNTPDYSYVRFTIPAHWTFTSGDVYNGGASKTTITSGASGGYKNVTAINADDGSFWYLIATSANLLLDGAHGIITEDGSANLETFNFTNVIIFTANFTTIIQTGNDVNLTVYSPSSVQNYTQEATPSSSQVSMGTWDISSSAREYGLFKVQAFWSNSTDAGFVEKNLIILGRTELTFLEPTETYYFLNDQAFNITFFFNDTSGTGSPFSGPIDADYHRFWNGSSNNGPLSTNGTTGYYYVTINPSDYPYGPRVYDFNFNETGCINQTYSFTFHIVNNTAINDWGASNSFTAENYVNATYKFYYNDTVNTVPIIGAEFSNVSEHANFIVHSQDHNDGNYTINVELDGVPIRSSPYWVNVTIRKDGLEAQMIKLFITVELIDINATYISEFSDSYYRYKQFDYWVRFYVNRTDTGAPIENLDDFDVNVTYNGGTPWPTDPEGVVLNYNPTTQEYTVNISIDDPTTYSGDYSITLNISKAGIYNWTTLTVGFTLIGNFTEVINFTLLRGSSILYPLLYDDYYNSTIGTPLTFECNVTDLNRTSNYLTSGVVLQVSIFYFKSNDPNVNGSLSGTFVIGVGGCIGTINMDNLPSTGNYTINVTITIRNYEPVSKIFKIQMSSSVGGFSGFTLEQLILYGSLLGAAILGVLGVYVGYKKVVVPKKHAKKRALTEVETIFDDAVSLEHILVLYKASGMCAYFKSFGLEEIDPELISGFLSAVSSFGKEMESTQALNEINYGDKQILLSDGQYIRVALVLGKKPSMVTKHHLSEFIAAFERIYAKVLPGWRGNLKAFSDSGKLIDEYLSTSIILPHEIKYRSKSVKSLKKPTSKDILKVAQNLVKDSDRKYFFIGQLLTIAVERLGKDKAEVFMGIKELRDTELLAPIEIGAIDAQPISQQEINLISQRVSQFTAMSPEQKQRLIEDLASMKSPAEREAYLSSIEDQHEIISKPTVESAEIPQVRNEKTAKKEISNMRKKAQSAKKQKNFKEALQTLNNAAALATNWELQKDYEALNDEIRMFTILDLEEKKKNFEEQAKRAINTVKYLDAAQYYQLAAETASKIFKLGKNDAMKEVKRLTNKSKECERLAE